MYSLEVFDLVADLEEYYEAAGFAKVHERVLKDMTDDEIRQLYRETYKTEPEDPDFQQQPEAPRV